MPISTKNQRFRKVFRSRPRHALSTHRDDRYRCKASPGVPLQAADDNHGHRFCLGSGVTPLQLVAKGVKVADQPTPKHILNILETEQS